MKQLAQAWAIAPAFITSAALLGCGGGNGDIVATTSPTGGGNDTTQPSGESSTTPEPASLSFRSAGMVMSTFTVSDVAGNQSLNAVMMTSAGMKTVSTPALPAATITSIKSTLAPGNLVDWLPGTATNSIALPSEPAQAFNVVLSKGSSATAQFNLQKYGAAITRNNGVPGPMVAAGWIYNKNASTITVGDGTLVTADISGRAYDMPIKRYEETYTVSPDVKVYNVNTSDYAKSEPSTFAAVPVTADYKYSTTSRQAAYLLFDSNYQSAADAKVVAIWYFTPKSASDGKPVWEVPTQSPLLANKGVDPVTGLAYVDIAATSPGSAPYTRSTEPFVMVKDTMYFVGDNEVASYVLKADMGTEDPSDDKIIKVDAGWPNSGYQYWKNMEILGIDPRSVTDIWLTHGHSDHYGTVVEQLKMMDNAGKSANLWASKEDAVGVKTDLQGNTWDIAGALPTSETTIRARTNRFYDYDQWYDFGNVKIMVIWSPGHTPGSTNMLFQVKNPTDGKFYTFGYHGGYGFNGLTAPTASNGWLRLSYQHGFSYLQNNIDVDFVSPQHTNQYPIVDVYQALKAYNRDPANAGKQLTMMDAMTSKVYDSPSIGGAKLSSEFANQLEKRRSVASYAASDAANSSYKSIETSGPFKPGRASGLTNVQATILDSGKIIQGFVGAQNKNPAIPLLANGIVIPTDAYVNDPSGYYVQVSIDVKDSTYKGYIPDGFSQASPGTGTTITYKGGPVESVHAAKGTFHPPEVLRTQRLGTLADAQQVLASITKGKAVTISLTPASEIVVPADVTKTFQ